MCKGELLFIHNRYITPGKSCIIHTWLSWSCLTYQQKQLMHFMRKEKLI